MTKPAKKRGCATAFLIFLAALVVLAGGLSIYGYIARQDTARMLENRIVKLESLSYIDLPATRFIGMSEDENEWPEALIAREELWRRRGDFMPVLDAMTEYATEITDMCDLTHNNNLEHDENSREIYLVGKFMQAGTPVPEGFDYYDIPATKVGLCVVRGGFDDMLDKGAGMIWDKIERGKYEVPYPDGWFFAQVYMEETVTDANVVSRMGFINPCR